MQALAQLRGAALVVVALHRAAVAVEDVGRGLPSWPSPLPFHAAPRCSTIIRHDVGSQQPPRMRRPIACEAVGHIEGLGGGQVAEALAGQAHLQAPDALLARELAQRGQQVAADFLAAPRRA